MLGTFFVYICDKCKVMAQTNICLTTSHLLISPTSNDAVWTCNWSFCTKQEPNKTIGKIGFNGNPKNGQVELWYEITEQQDNSDIIVEVLNKIIRWTFKHKDIYRINFDSKCNWEMLEFIDFQSQKTEGGENVSFHIDKHEPYWSIIGIFLGTFIGEAIKTIILKVYGQDSYLLFSSLTFIGAILGALIGKLLSRKEMKRRENIINSK